MRSLELRRMMNVGIWTSALVAHVVVVGLLAYLVSTSRGRVPRDPVTGDFYLHYSIAFKILPLILALVVAVIALLAIYDIPVTRGNVAIYLAVFLPVSGVLFWLTWEATQTAHRVTKEGIYAHSPWRADSFVRWEEVAEVRFSSVAQTIDIVTPRARLRFHMYLSGLREFAERINERVPAPKRQNAAKMLGLLLKQ